MIGTARREYQSTGMEKEELVVYYRLAILVEAILIQYRQ